MLIAYMQLKIFNCILKHIKIFIFLKNDSSSLVDQ